MDKQDDFRESWDPVLLAAVRAASAGAECGTAEDPSAAAGWTPADEQAWAARGPDVGRRVVAKARRLRAAGVGAGGGHRLAWFDDADVPSDEPSPPASSTAQHALLQTFYDPQPSSLTWHCDEEADDRSLEQLIAAYRGLIERRRRPEADEAPLLELIGRGGQGVVFRTECRGTDGFAFPSAVKVYSPEKYPSVRSYENAMRRSARVASLVAAAHHASVVGIQGFRQRDGIRLLFMDLIDGYDLRVLLSPKVYEHVRRASSRREWAPVRKVVVTHGPERARLLPGTAVAIIRDCLLGLSVLHRLGIVHGDIKPANIMLNRVLGRAAIIDLGSAFEISHPPAAIIQTPAYAAPEAVREGTRSPKSDLVSLGYVFVECLVGQRLFRRDMSATELQEAKHTLPQRLRSLLPDKVAGSWRLLRFCEKLTAFDPQDRFDSADDADQNEECGASAFLRELALVGLSAVYDIDIRHWLDAVSCGN